MQNHQPARVLDRVGERSQHLLARSFRGVEACLPQGAAGHGFLNRIHVSSLDQTLSNHRHPAGSIDVHGHKPPPRLQVGDQGCPRTDLVEVVDLQIHTHLPRHRQEVQNGVGGSTRGRHTGNGVVEGLTRDQISGADAAPDKIHHQLSSLECHPILAGIGGRHTGGSHRRQAQEFERRGHGVGRVLAAAGTGPRAGRVLDLQQLGIADTPRRVGAHGFKDILDGDVAPSILPRSDGSPIQHQRGHVEPHQPHGASRQGLVAADQGDHGVEHVAPSHQLDRVGHNLTAHQGGFHSFGAHGDSVAHGDGVELHGSPAGSTHPLLDLCRQSPEVEVAGHGLDPGIGDPDNGPGQVLIGVPDALQKGARRGAVPALQDGSAAQWWVGHAIPPESREFPAETAGIGVRALPGGSYESESTHLHGLSGTRALSCKTGFLFIEHGCTG